MMIFTYVMSTYFTKVTFLHDVPFINDTLSQPLPETLYALAEASELYTHAVFQLVVRKTASLERTL
jgi:hypothetical protein